VWFAGDDHERRGVEAALAMPASLARLPAALTGGRRLRAGVGVHTGSVTAVLAGGHQKGLFLCGPSMTALTDLQGAAGPGQVLVSPLLADRLPGHWPRQPVGPGAEVRRRGAGHPVPVAPAGPGSRDGAPQARLLTLLAPPVRALAAGDVPSGDHRSASVGFVVVPRLDDLLDERGPDAVHAVLDEVATHVSTIGDELGVSWLDVDVGAGCVKLLLTSGAPRAVDDDELRLLIALRRIVDQVSRRRQRMPATCAAGSLSPRVAPPRPRS
jgi:hypothetical protein